MKILTVVGARPQFIKAAPVSREIRRRGLHEVIVHTGQHFDRNMSDVFFTELDIPQPDYNLNISGGNHGEMTARMLMGIEEILLKEKPSWVLIYGDTNSTLAGALAASKLHIPIAHVESGLRSFNMRMPEEINRILADRISTLHLCTSELAVQNLKNEGLSGTAHNVGDVMYDAALYFSDEKFKRSAGLDGLNLKSREFALVTCHRAENTNDKERLQNILAAIDEISLHMKVVLPLHPRTRQYIDEYGFAGYLRNVTLTEPMSYLDMLWLEKNAKVIITDSGGVQKEAYFFNIPCVTIRDETEWLETVKSGANRLAGTCKDKIVDYVLNAQTSVASNANVYGDGYASQKILDVMMGGFGSV